MSACRFLDRYGPWAVVTGASSGIGRAMAVHLAQRGFHTALIGRRQHSLLALGAQLRERFGINTRQLAVDLTDPRANDALFATTGDIDIGLLIAAAGFGTSGSFLHANMADEIEMITLNCTRVLQQCRHYGERFAARGRGGIILMGSLLGFQGVPRSSNYAATKAYVQTLAEGLHAELKHAGVDVLSSAPGPVRSGFETRADMRMKFGISTDSVAVGTLEALGSRSTAVPGLLSKLLTYSLAPLPRAMRTRILGRVMDGMTSHQATL